MEKAYAFYLFVSFVYLFKTKTYIKNGMTRGPMGKAGRKGKRHFSTSLSVRKKIITTTVQARKGNCPSICQQEARANTDAKEQKNSLNNRSPSSRFAII